MLEKLETHLLLVEDNPGDARLVEVMLKEAGSFRVTWIERLADAVTQLATTDHGIDIVLLDLSLPDCQGLDTVRTIRRTAPTLPIVILTGFDDEQLGLKAVQEGCQDYLVKGQGDANLLRRTIAYSIERRNSEEEREQHAKRLKRILKQTVQAVSLTIEMRDPYTAGHQRRVAQLARAIGQRMNLGEDVLDGLETAAFIHDIGKINIPADFLARPGQLSDAAFHVIKAHPRVGYDIVQGIEFPWPVADMILQHHERLDGSGYPNALKGDDIILGARILAVADVVEAISSHRPYRPSLGIEAAIEEVRKNAGVCYDAAVVEACEAVVRNREFEASEGSDSTAPALFT